MSNSIWKMPDQKPDVFKPHTIMVVYEAHDEAELMLSTQYESYTADRYINRWCYLDELLAQADKAKWLQKAVDVSVDTLKGIDWCAQDYAKAQEALNEIKQLIKETTNDK